MNKILVIAPHPDDEILGCGGIIKKLTKLSKVVDILIVSKGKESLYSESRIKNVRNEATIAHKALGITKTIFLDFPAPELDTVPLSVIANDIFNCIKEFQSDTLFIPHRGDIHNDHRVVFNASLVASRPVNNCPVRRIFAYETLSETEWAPPFGDDAFIPDFFVNITDSFSDKVNSMKCYKSQLKEFPNPRSEKSLESLASLRGGSVGLQYAEAFMTIRMIAL